jgi:hypothetical protein
MRQHVDKILNSTSTQKNLHRAFLSTRCPYLFLHRTFLPTLILSLSLSRSAQHLVLSSLSRSPSATAPATTPCRGSAPAVRRSGGRSDDHLAPCAAVAPLRLPPRARATAPMMRRHCGGRRSRGSPPTPLVVEVFLQASCPGCSRSHIFLEHVALCYFPVSEFTAVPIPVNLPLAFIGFCLNVAPKPGPFVLHNQNLPP